MIGLPINAVERETGLSKDLLRMWERRYGFPQPARDANGDRLYPPDQVARLSLLRRLLDQGHRPGRLLAMAEADLLALAAPPTAQVASSHTPQLDALIASLQAHDLAAIQHLLQRQQNEHSLRDFVSGFLAAANRAVGDAWMQGQIGIAAEHLYTEQVQRHLRQMLQALPANQSEPRCLLTTVNGEQHGLGLLMVEAMLRLSGCSPVNLGPGMPLAEIRAAAEAHHSQVVLLSFSAAFPAGETAKAIADLRRLLPGNIALWCGGSGVRLLRRQPEGVLITPELGDVDKAVEAWRAAQ